MTFEFKLPDVGEGIHEGEIVNWLVDEGEAVDADQDIVEVMTDKATVQISSPIAGTIQNLVYGEGEVVTVGEVFVLIAPDDDAGIDEAEQAPEPETEPEAEPAAEPEPVHVSSGSNGDIVRTRTPRSVLAPPSVRIEARKHGVDLTQLDGSGPAGRISLDDLRAYLDSGPEAPTGQSQRSPSGRTDSFDFDFPSIDREGAREIVPIQAAASSPKATAHRSMTLQPHFMHSVPVRADNLLEALSKEDGGRIRPVAAVAKALAIALADHARLNGLVDEHDDELVIRETVNVAVAWPTADGHELRVVPEPGNKGLLEIEAILETGGEDVEPTVTIATLDDKDAFVSTPVLVHPQVTGAVVGSLDDVAVLDEEGTAVPGHELSLSFCFDHRWIDGYDGALLAEDVRKALEKPGSMLLA